MAGYLTGVRLPEDIERGALGGPRFNTAVLELESGFEKRNANWSVPRGEWDVGFGLLLKFQADPTDTKLDLDDLINFFYVVQGRAFSWRFKDWADFEIGYENGSTIDPQFLGLGDGTTVLFQAFKRYTFGSQTFDRVLTKLVDGGFLQLFKNSILLNDPADYTVDLDRGRFTLATAPLGPGSGGQGPSGEDLLEFRSLFDVHARLDTDDLKVNMEIFNAGSWPNIPAVELRGNGID